VSVFAWFRIGSCERDHDPLVFTIAREIFELSLSKITSRSRRIAIRNLKENETSIKGNFSMICD
jgi:hypothetical protein